MRKSSIIYISLLVMAIISAILYAITNEIIFYYIIIISFFGYLFTYLPMIRKNNSLY